MYQNKWQNKNVVKYQDKNANKSPNKCPNKNVKMFPNKNAKMFPKKFVIKCPSKNVDKFPDKNAKKFPVKVAKMFPSKNVGKFQNKHVKMFPNKNVEKNQDKSVNRYLDKNVNKCPNKNVNKCQKKNVKISIFVKFANNLLISEENKKSSHPTFFIYHQSFPVPLLFIKIDSILRFYFKSYFLYIVLTLTKFSPINSVKLQVVKSKDFLSMSQLTSNDKIWHTKNMFSGQIPNN